MTTAGHKVTFMVILGILMVGSVNAAYSAEPSPQSAISPVSKLLIGPADLRRGFFWVVQLNYAPDIKVFFCRWIYRHQFQDWQCSAGVDLVSEKLSSDAQLTLVLAKDDEWGIYLTNRNHAYSKATCKYNLKLKGADIVGAPNCYKFDIPLDSQLKPLAQDTPMAVSGIEEYCPKPYFEDGGSMWICDSGFTPNRFHACDNNGRNGVSKSDYAQAGEDSQPCPANSAARNARILIIRSTHGEK